jgi:hypothetical protein
MSTAIGLVTDPVPQNYSQPFRHWNERSWIRSKPFTEGSLEDGTAFPLAIIPLANHPRIAKDRKQQSQVLAWRALAHLEFTTVLELVHVNPVCSALAQGQSQVPLTISQRQDALRIYCDEGGHALMVELLAQQVQDLYGLDRSALGRPGFDDIISGLLQEHAGSLPPELLHCFFVAVSETLITKLLSEVPNDKTVASAVRAVLRDHAADESRHREFFRWYFPLLWNSLDGQEKQLVGRLLPDLLWAFLGPDRRLDLNILSSLGYDRREAGQILDETYRPEAVAAYVNHAARPTLQLFQQAGVMDDTSTRLYFQERHLWLPS